uniref:Uncharacterized protein n=1 Tax=Sphaerodactylus townsendi TaxID=933632 RepID=A0ACB8G961_9SAUR
MLICTAIQAVCIINHSKHQAQVCSSCTATPWNRLAAITPRNCLANILFAFLKYDVYLQHRRRRWCSSNFKNAAVGLLLQVMQTPEMEILKIDVTRLDREKVLFFSYEGCQSFVRQVYMIFPRDWCILHVNFPVSRSAISYPFI